MRRDSPKCPGHPTPRGAPASLQVKDDLLHRAREGIGRLVLLCHIDHAAVVPADVHTGIGREEQRDRVRLGPGTDLLVVRPQRHCAAGAWDTEIRGPTGVVFHQRDL
ncbi:MAG: hypothetical protein KIT39_13370 [Nitrospirales bacterium]|nr:hypothetical protein [Nitrospirales bacterium]